MTGKPKKTVTNKTTNPNRTTGRAFSLRLTDNERIALEALTKKIQAKVPKKYVSMSLIFRAVTQLDSPQAIGTLVRIVREL